ncbi:MAG: hypothetical protein SGJ04_02945 [Bacteroidota bacterium]|nr:hypothetical protein [Bacteroidota bacterium]
MTFEADKIELFNFKIIVLALKSPIDFSITNSSNFKAESSLKLEFDGNLNTCLATLSTKLTLDSNSEAAKKKLKAHCKFELSYLYHWEFAQNLFSQRVDGSLNVHNEETFNHLVNALTSVTYSTSRGVLMARLQGTVFQKSNLPIINPDNLLSENSITIKLKQPII